jgi:hypothetical protein
MIKIEDIRIKIEDTQLWLKVVAPNPNALSPSRCIRRFKTVIPGPGSEPQINPSSRPSEHQDSSRTTTQSLMPNPVQTRSINTNGVSATHWKNGPPASVIF